VAVVGVEAASWAAGAALSAPVAAAVPRAVATVLELLREEGDG
jgi:Ni,Fe-hydrogenase maturation factor